ncbi:MAG: phosphoribosylformylglycinamidine synthase subunit PurS [Bacteroidales bacterium]|jgi:phosphoribosylformylglycinamidine synthase|nr:phosphoribosylformylglycinamidine synthase subunit PurS [Bacteroidales bacterium]MCK9498680.1 phosphoribosylformylglycinamidine synthase subunit PurS [Bacteroidales bacterium]MDY0313545.1 phosphoribosylformylglycinamidine synthase subunit PurS [Bacteroidales bacterium]NLB85573.1 phosphoribosylformylglycinamidine synthase subunit PurS [Bacteroidales bacterium]
MKFLAQINIMPQKALLDPQGKAVMSSAKKIGFDTVNNIRIGKHIEVEIEAKDKQNAADLIDDLCKKILTNPIVESYNFNLFEI